MLRGFPRREWILAFRAVRLRVSGMHGGFWAAEQRDNAVTATGFAGREQGNLFTGGGIISGTGKSG